MAQRKKEGLYLKRPSHLFTCQAWTPRAKKKGGGGMPKTNFTMLIKPVCPERKVEKLTERQRTM